MKEVFEKSLNFIKQNPMIIYSLVLVFIIPIAIYLNTYLTVKSFEENLTSIIRSKAALAEDVAKFIARENIGNPEALQKLIIETKNLNADIGIFEVLVPSKNIDGFQVIASSDIEDIGKDFSETKEIFYHQIAWNQPNDNISFVTTDEKGRIWNVIETIKSSDGEKIGLVSMSLPLLEFDKMNSQAEIRSYFILAITILVVLLLVSNNARLFGYALTLTKLKEIDKMKDEFVSMTSHELKSPLVVLRGYVDLLKEKIVSQKDNDDQLHYLENMENSVTRLNELITDILEVSRIEQNRLPIEMKNIDLNALLKKVSEEMKIAADQKGLEMIYVSSGVSYVSADESRMKQIIINLLSNAIKYSDSGTIEIKTVEDEKYAYITVIDNGIGMSPEAMGRLFTKFYRISNDRTKKIAGTGLGLWISREIARKMGGDISVQSIEGVGSQFTLKIKKA